MRSSINPLFHIGALGALLCYAGSTGFGQTTTPAASGASPAAAAAVASPPLPGTAIPIRYALTKAANVSINIYDEKGAVVRELVHVAPRRAGDNLEVWDGLDNTGKPLPAAKYSWKLLATPGLKAEYIMSVGSNYPVQAPSIEQAGWNDTAPGSHVGPSALQTDESGIYIATGNENIEPSVVKINLDGTKKLWNAPWPGAFGRFMSMARIGENLWGLNTDGTVVPYRADNGFRSHEPNVLWKGIPTIGGPIVQGNDKQNAIDITADGRSLVMGFGAGKATPGLIRWFDSSTYKHELDVPLPNLLVLAADGKGAVYASNGTQIYRVSKDAPQPVKLVEGLKEARCLMVDPPTGDLLIYDGARYGGGDSQIKRYSKDGKFLRAYGRPGGRRDGLYTREEQESFAAVIDIEPIPGGGFVICEGAAPRRVAVFDAEGKLQREWYGGTVWAPFIFPEPDNPNAVWIASEWGSFMRCVVDYKTKTWKVHSTYGFGANALIQQPGISQGMEARMHNGELYLVRGEVYPIIMRVDRKNWKLMPATVLLSHVAHYAGEQRPFVMEEFRKTKGNNETLVWTDADGDGQAQSSEIQWTGKGVWANGGYVDKDFNTYNIWAKYLATIPVKSWNAVGAPVYDPEDMALKKVGPELPVREAGGNTFFARDPQTGDFYAAKNYHLGWAASSDSFLVKLRPDGTHAWTVGRVGGNPGQIRYFRHIFGFAKGCIAAANTSNEFPQDGVSQTYVWDRDGLFVGGLLDHPNLKGINFGRYALGAESINGVIYENPATGEVLLFGHFTNEGRIFRITGWDGWQRASGALELKAPAEAGGNGVTATFLKADGTQVGQWSMKQIDFDPAKELKSVTAKAVEQTGKYTVRWSGRIAAPADGEYSFSVQGAGDVHLVVGDRVALSRQAAATVATPIAMKAAQRLEFQLEYVPQPDAARGLKLLWNAKDQEPALVPQTALFAAPYLHEQPLGKGTGLTGNYYYVWTPDISNEAALPKPSLTRVDPVVTMKWGPAVSRENAPLVPPADSKDPAARYAVIWKGFYQPRDSGYIRMSLKDGQIALGDSPFGRGQEGFLEAGRKYPIRLAYTNFMHGHLYNPTRPNEPTLMVSNFPGPYAPFTITTVPQSQLFPADK